MVVRLVQPTKDLLQRGVEVLALWYASKLVQTASRGNEITQSRHGSSGSSTAGTAVLQAGDIVSFVLMAQATFQQIRWLWTSTALLGDIVFKPASSMLRLLGSCPKIPLNDPPLSQMRLFHGPRHRMTWSIEFCDVHFSYPGVPGPPFYVGCPLRWRRGAW